MIRNDSVVSSMGAGSTYFAGAQRWSLGSRHQPETLTMSTLKSSESGCDVFLPTLTCFLALNPL